MRSWRVKWSSDNAYAGVTLESIPPGLEESQKVWQTGLELSASHASPWLICAD